MEVDLTELVGLTLSQVKINADNTEIFFVSTDSRFFKMWHPQDCCECVCLEDLIGDINDLIGSPILCAAEASNSDACKTESESGTWTFYHISTIKGTVTLRWYGSSNGYYSESVSFEEISRPLCFKEAGPFQIGEEVVIVASGRAPFRKLIGQRMRVLDFRPPNAFNSSRTKTMIVELIDSDFNTYSFFESELEKL